MATVFISYETTTGLEFAKHLQKALEKFEISSFVAKTNITVGKDPNQIIIQNIEDCEFFVPIITITALKSEEVKKEFGRATNLKKCIIPCIKEGIEDRGKEEFKELFDYQYFKFETKEDIANSITETILKAKIHNYKDSLRRLKDPITREEIIDSLLNDLISTQNEIYFWMTESDADPNQEYVFRMRIEHLKKQKKEELEKIKKEITKKGFPLMAYK
jgi:hypothetical protein